MLSIKCVIDPRDKSRKDKPVSYETIFENILYHKVY